MATPECRKFAPNIFNKSKCSNCFRLKEDHSASAIELNRASRKISKCGYLFVAPDWDFANPVNRTKRWQRRWFVLYDDGELTYSVDDHPETIPQACIDMNKVMEVARADEVTGNPYSVAITAPERIHFVKGTCKEESNWWLEVLQIFPRSSIKTGRAKRNATFPGGIATTYISQYTAAAAAATAIQTPPVKCEPIVVADKPTAENLGPTVQSSLSSPPPPAAAAAVEEVHTLASLRNLTADGRPSGGAAELIIVAEPPQATARTSSPASPLLSSRKEAAVKPSGLLEPLATSTPRLLEPLSPSTHRILEPLNAGSATPRLLEPLSAGGLDVAARYKKIKTKAGEGTTRAYRSLRSNTSENLSAIPQDYGRAKLSRYSTLQLAAASTAEATTVVGEPTTNSTSLSLPTAANTSSSLSLSLPTAVTPSTISINTQEASVNAITSTPPAEPLPPAPDSPPEKLPARGVPDGCGLEILSAMSPSIPLPSPHELLNLKKGWLMKQGLTKEWHKHWFVLQGSALMYFRDPGSENSGLMDGIIDLGLVQKVEERDVQRNYGFVVLTLDEREYILSAVTHGIRNNWINAIKSAANINSLPEPDIAAGTPAKLLKESQPPANDESITTAADLKQLSRRSTADSIILAARSSSPQTSYLNTETPVASGTCCLTTRQRSESGSGSASGGLASPPLTRTPTSRIKKEKSGSGSRLSGSSGSRSVLKGGSSSGGGGVDSSAVGTSSEKLASSFFLHKDRAEANMIPERDTDHQAVSHLADGSSSTSSTAEDMASEANNNSKTNEDTAAKIARQAADIERLRTRLDNMNSDMDTTLKNLNSEQLRSLELSQQLAELEQAHSLLKIKSTNAEKSLREQSKEITNLNQRVREFSDLSSQYKAQVAENRALRQKLDKMERLSHGPNWKTLYESLQEQHHKERALWESKLKETETELQNMIETSHELEQKTHIITDLSHQLQESETRINQLIYQNDALNREGEVLKQGFAEEMKRLKENIKELEEYIDKTDVDKSEEVSSKESEILRLRNELQEKVGLEKQMQLMEAELSQGREEVETLRSQLQEAKAPEKEVVVGKTRSRSLCSSRESLDTSGRQLRMVRMDSITELVDFIEDVDHVSGLDREKLILCYEDLVCRLNKAVQEIRTLKASIKSAQAMADEAEIKQLQISQTLASKESQNSEELRLMSTKIEDLTVKYLAAEKQVRSLKLKLKNAEGGKERRRSSTGIKPDELLVGKEAEHVLEDIELCLANIEGYIGRGKEASTVGVLGRTSEPAYRRKSYETSTKASRARRKSSEIASGSATAGELSFVDRLKRTERTISDINRKLSCGHMGGIGASGGLHSSANVDQLRKQMLALVSRTRDELASGGHMNADLADMLTCLESAVASMDMPTGDPADLGNKLPGFPPASEDLSSHVDTLMSFLYQTVERVYEMRKEVTGQGDSAAVVTAIKASSIYDLGVMVGNSGELANLIKAQEAGLQACLLMDLQQRVATIEARCVAYSHHGDQTLLNSYTDMTKSLLLRLLESKHFVPLSAHSRKKLKALSSIPLADFSALSAVFRRLKKEAQSVFRRIGGLTSELIVMLSDAVACDLADKDTILESIRSEVFSLMEEDERLREFQSSLVSIYLISCTGSNLEEGGGSRDPEQVSLMADWDEALQSQAEVTRILVEQEFQELNAALEQKLDLATSQDFPVVPHREPMSSLSGENLGEAVAKIANMVAQKCITEAQITILRTILGLEEEAEEGDPLEEEGVIHADAFVFNPENMNSECNEFMLVLNNYRQQQECHQSGGETHLNTRGNSRWGGRSPPTRLSIGGGNSDGGGSSTTSVSLSLETNLRNIRQENENKKARLNAALELRRSSTGTNSDVQLSPLSPLASATTANLPQVEQERLQDLRIWCEKSMTAMERSYENLLNELQLQHNREKMSLRREKDLALAEETRATLAALDAMRKAHESEVQKEVEKFKKEFLQEVRSKECIGALQSEFQEDRAVIRRELLSATGGGGVETTDWEATSKDEELSSSSVSCRRQLSRLTRSPSCPRLYSGMSLSATGPGSPTPRRFAAAETDGAAGDPVPAVEEPMKSPLTGMVANRKRVFENEY